LPRGNSIKTLIMIIDNFLLPRFLILELVFACHYLQFARACTVLCGAGKEVREVAGEEAVEQRDAIEKTFERKYKIVPKKGLIGLKKILLTEKIRKEKKSLKKSSSENSKGLKGLKELLNKDVEVNNETIIREVQNETSLKVPGGLIGLKYKLKSSSVCEVSLDDQGWAHPPLLYNVSGLPILPLPSSKAMVVRVDKGETITLACPGGRVNRTKSSMALVQCVHEDMFLLNTSMVDIEQLGCSKNPKEKEMLDNGAESCGPEHSGQLSSLGFVVGRELKPLVTVCHTKQGEVTHYTNHTVLGHLLHTRVVPENRPNFKEGRVYFQSVSANSAYKQTRQKRLFTTLFGSSESGSLFQPKKGLYLARGHLTPSGDLLYRDWQEVTYLYSNVVPQWQVVNNGNWRDVEEAVRAKAKKRESTLQVFTGTKGVLKLRGEELWLVKNSIPVPEYLWKLVVDPLSGDSIVFVTLNNPHLQHLTRSVTLCKDVCDQAGWSERLMEREVIEQGYTQCCNTRQFREKVPWLPAIGEKEILKF